jgi:tetratricopeptide (TPR) repeat protein
MRRCSCGRSLLLVLLVVGLASGCVTPARPRASADPVVEMLRAGDLAGKHPFELDVPAQEEVRRKVGMHGSQQDRLRRAVSYLTDPSGLYFHYVPQRTLTASDAFREPRGDCMTFASLLYAMARALKVDISFVYARRSLLYTEEAGTFVASAHIALAHGSGADRLVADLASWMAGWQDVHYEPVDEQMAAALFYNNLAVKELHEGRPEQARTMLELLVAQVPQVPELHANLGALLLREGSTALARQRLEEARKRFPEHPTLWMHALRAARMEGDTEQAERLLASAEQVAARHPSFHLLRAEEAWREQDPARADSHLKQALARVPDSPLLLAWRVRTLLALRRTQEGLTLYTQLRRDFPSSAWVQELPGLHPELQEGDPLPASQVPALARRTKFKSPP